MVQVRGVKRAHSNRYDYASVGIGWSGDTIIITAREGGDTSGAAELSLRDVRKFRAALDAAIAKVEGEA
jgi:hypothetical protein